jgi:flagellar protein FlbD
VILLTRLNGPVFALNPDLVERADCTPDTVITLVDGTKYVVAESLPELVGLIRQYRAGIVADAQHLVNHPELLDVTPSTQDEPADNNVLPLHRREH